jgi:hypothetical protein
MSNTIQFNDVKEGQLFIHPEIRGVLKKTGALLGQPHDKGADARVIYPEEEVRLYVPKKGGKK